MVLSTFITVVIAWGGKDFGYLEMAIKSLALQDTPIQEVVVVIDSLSPEREKGELEELLDWCTCKILSTNNAGPAGARNLALANLNPLTTHVLIQDADDVSHPTRVRVLLHELTERDLDAIGSQAVIIDKWFVSYHPRRPISELKLQRLTLQNKMKFIHSSMMFNVTNRHEDFFYPETDLRGEDFLLIRQLNQSGWKIGNSKHYLFGYRHRIFRTLRAYALDTEIRRKNQSLALMGSYAGHLILRATSNVRGWKDLLAWRKFLKELGSDS